MEPGDALDAARQLAGLSLPDLWLRCCAIGSDLTPGQLQEVLGGAARPTSFEYDVIAQALNDTFLERGGDHPVPYAEDLDD
jgi:hypothetical protein